LIVAFLVNRYIIGFYKRVRLLDFGSSVTRCPRGETDSKRPTDLSDIA